MALWDQRAFRNNYMDFESTVWHNMKNHQNNITFLAIGHLARRPIALRGALQGARGILLIPLQYCIRLGQNTKLPNLMQPLSRAESSQHLNWLLRTVV